MTLLQDSRGTLRALRRSGALSIVVVLMLALAIGATTAIFSIVHGVLVRPLPFRDPHALVMLWGRNETQGTTVGELSLADMREWRKQATAPAIEIFTSVNWSYRVTAPGEPFTLSYSSVSGSFFETLGARPLLGRTFRPEDDRADAPGAIVLGADLWRRRFSSDPAIIGKSITIGEGADARPFEVLGVMGPEFQFPAGAEAWAPAARDIGEFTKKRAEGYTDWENLRVFFTFGRLAPGATTERVTAELSAIAQRREIAMGDADSRMKVVVTPFLTYFFGPSRPALLAIAGAVVILLLIACANAAGLLLVQGVARQREVAVRRALGASRWQVARHSLLEAAILVALSACLGVGVAFASFKTLVALSPSNVPRLADASIDGAALLFAMAVAAMTVVVVGAWPALQFSNAPLAGVLSQSGRTGTSAPRAGRARKLLVVAQLAAALVLLTAAGLLSRSFLALMRIDLGFDPRNVLTFEIYSPPTKYPTEASRRVLVANAIEAIRRLPTVRAAGAIYQRPFAHGPVGMDTGFISEQQPLTDESYNRNPHLNWEAITPGYLDAMKTRLIRGRPLDDRDDEVAPVSILVSESLARRVWPGQEAIGKRLLGYGSVGGEQRKWQTVVGIVEDVRYREIQESRLDLYMSFRQAPSPVKHFVVRVDGDPRRIVADIKSVLRRVEPELTVESVTTMEEIVDGTVAPWRFNMLVFGIFAATALLFAAIGLSAVIAYAVRQRTREIGVRMALGARGSDVVRLVVREAAELTVIALAIGVCTTWILTRAIANLLFRVTPGDPVTLVATTTLLATVALVAAYLPARRATGIDPLIALRTD